MQNKKHRRPSWLRHAILAAVCFALLSGVLLADQQSGAVLDKQKIKTRLDEIAAHPSAEALARKKKSIAQLKRENIPAFESLPVIEDSTSSRIRTKEEVAHRAIALCLVMMKGGGMAQDKIEKLVARYGAATYFSPAEKKFIDDHAPSENMLNECSWRCESYWVMLWALGYVDTLNYPNLGCSIREAEKFLQRVTAEEFLANAKLRPPSEILDQADLIYRYHWALVDARLNKKNPPAGLVVDIVMERHRSLNWLIGYMSQDWDDVTDDT
jgi:hypothetical protein